MKKLSKLLAVFGLIIVAIAFFKSFRQVVKNSGYFNYNSPPPDGAVCLNSDRPDGCVHASSRTNHNVGSDHEINLVPRQFIRVPGTLNIIDYDRDAITSPSFCDMFNPRGNRPMTALYALGTIGGIQSSSSVVQDPPHLVGFQPQPGEKIYAPRFGDNFIYENYYAMILYIGSNQTGDYVVIQYSLQDGVGQGFTLYVFGLNVDPSLNSLYLSAVADKRWYLPGLRGDTPLGVPKGSEIWVAGRLDDYFIDPRSSTDWWNGCGKDASGSNITNPANPPGYTTTPNTPISTVGPKRTNDPKDLKPTFTALGMLEACPAEILVKTGKITQRQTNPPGQNYIPSNNPNTTKQINFECPEVQPVPEPPICTADDVSGFDMGPACAGIGDVTMSWCYPEHKDALMEKLRAAGKFCNGDEGATSRHISKYVWGYCVNDDGGPGFWLNRVKAQGGCEGLNEADKSTIGHCLNYYGSTGTRVANNNSVLPACIPSQNSGQQCVSECSPPIELTQNLQMFPSADCIKNGDCLVKIGLKNNSLSVPFVRDLANYFTGVLDAEHQSASELDRLQNFLRDATTNPDPSADVNELLAKAGVSRKLLPADIQDRLKCEFIDYVKQKKKDGTNTRYLDRTGSTIKEFKIYDRSVTTIECPPDLNPDSKYLTYKDWSKVWGAYWFGVPLFQNDDSQGKIEFVSPSMFSTRELDNDPRYPNNELGPIYVSLPEMNRLNAATNILQDALVPQETLIQRSKDIVTDPEHNLPTYGKVLDPNKPVVACTQDGFKKYYDDTKLLYDPTKNLLTADGKSWNDLTTYTRGVTCDLAVVEGNTDPNKAKGCAVGPDGQMRCFRQDSGSAGPTGTAKNYEETIQVRTVFPNLFEIAEQTIQKSTGLLRIFQPLAQKQDKTNEFEKAFEPIPAAVPVTYDVSDRDVTLNTESGWQIFFYRLGGLWTARNFVLQLLTP